MQTRAPKSLSRTVPGEAIRGKAAWPGVSGQLATLACAGASAHTRGLARGVGRGRALHGVSSAFLPPVTKEATRKPASTSHHGRVRRRPTSAFRPGPGPRGAQRAEHPTGGSVSRVTLGARKPGLRAEPALSCVNVNPSGTSLTPCFSICKDDKSEGKPCSCSVKPTGSNKA